MPMKLVGRVTLVVAVEEGEHKGGGLEPASPGDAGNVVCEAPNWFLEEKVASVDEHQAAGSAVTSQAELTLESSNSTSGHFGNHKAGLSVPIALLSTETALAPATTLEDVQLWGTQDIMLSGSFTFISHINTQMVPLYLIASPPVRVYSGSSETSRYFGTHVAGRAGSGPLFRDDQTYLAFYSDPESSIFAFQIDFARLNKLHTSSLPSTTAETTDDIFEKVLSTKRRQKSNKFMLSTPEQNIQPTQLSTQHFTSNEQVSQAINKLILSGLRLRGVTTNAPTANERVAAREVYQMTQKAAVFAVRKFGSSQLSEKSSLTLDHLQDIVERLLQVFIDVE